MYQYPNLQWGRVHSKKIKKNTGPGPFKKNPRALRLLSKDFALFNIPNFPINTNMSVENYNNVVNGKTKNSPRTMNILLLTLPSVQNNVKTRIQTWKCN